MPPARAPIANRWTPYGLDRDPFFRNELGASDEALYPASAFFVGRAAELDRHALVTEVLRTLLEIRATQLEAGVARLRKAAARTEQLWDKVATIAEGNTRRGGSLGVAGVSVGTGVSTVAPRGAGDRYFDEVAGALGDLSDGGRVPVLLHVNNLENLRGADLAKAATLIRNLRDYLLIPGGHWLFVGRTGVTQDVFEAGEEVISALLAPGRGPTDASPCREVVDR